MSTVIEQGGMTYAAQSVNLQKGVVFSALHPDAGAKPRKEAKVDADEDGQTGIWQNWGANNDWPTVVRKKMEDSTIAAPLLFKAVCSMYGLGLTYWQENRTQKGIEKDWSELPEVESFLEQNSIQNIAQERLMDYKFFNNIFQEFILNGKGDKVVNTFHLEAEFCRKSQQKGGQNRSALIGYCGDWEKAEEDNIEKIPLAYPRIDSRDQVLKTAGKKKKFAVHSFFPTPGHPYYAVPPHKGLHRKKGWLDYSNSVPVILNSIIENSMNLKYHIKIPHAYWPAAFPKWNEYTDDERKTKREEKLKEMNNWLTGKDNVMKSFISHYEIDPVTKERIPGWEIEEFSQKLELDNQLLTSQESDAHIARALNIDPSLAGLQPQGGKMGAGSGSDKRTAFTNAVSLSHAEQLIVLDFLYVIGKINNWPNKLRWGFVHEVPKTLNENKSGKEVEE